MQRQEQKRPRPRDALFIPDGTLIVFRLTYSSFPSPVQFSAIKMGERVQKSSGDASDSEIAATAAAFSEKFGGGGSDPVAGGKTSDFR